jgi:CubicO group peptidase (beta-lactamase class C family)
MAVRGEVLPNLMAVSCLSAAKSSILTTMKSLIDPLLRQALRQKTASVIACAIIKPDSVLYQKSFAEDWTGGPPPRFFDIASVTKTFTATAFIRLHRQHKIDISAPVSRYLPAFSSPQVTIKQLLTHTSGIPRAFIRSKYSRQEILDELFSARYTPVAVPVYSDGNFLLLGELLEQHGGLENIFNREIFTPAGLSQTFFNPLRHNIMPADIAPAEIHAVRGLVQGEVHDDKAFSFNGIAGHAGLFSTLNDIIRYSQALLNGTLLDTNAKQLLKESSAGSYKNRFTLGWFREDELEGSSANDFIVVRTGFTGTSLLLNFDRETAVILLTNRTFPHRDNPLIFELRKKLHNLVYREGL